MYSVGVYAKDHHKKLLVQKKSLVVLCRLYEDMRNSCFNL